MNRVIGVADGRRCPSCGRAPGDEQGPWCGWCGAWLGTPDGPSDHPGAGSVDTGVVEPAPGDAGASRDVGRHRRRAFAAAVVLGLAGAVVLWPAADEDVTRPGQGATVLVGRLDDATGRSSDAEPPSVTDRLWSTVWRTPDDDPVVVPVVARGPDALVVGDRVLSLRDGRVLGVATAADSRGAEVAPDGLVASADEDTLALVDGTNGRVVDRVVVRADGQRGPVGGRSTEVAGWVDDVVVLRTWDVGLGSSTSRGVDRADGTVVWETFGDAYAPVGEGWFVGLAAPGMVLFDGRTGALVAVPDVVAGGSLGAPVVRDGIAYAATDEGLVAWRPRTGNLLGAVGRAAPPPFGGGTRDGDTGPPQRIEWVELAGGRVEQATFPGVAVLGDTIVTATPAGVRGERADGADWEVVVPALLGIAAAPEAGVVVALSGVSADRGSGLLPGGDGALEALVYDRRGELLVRSEVAPAPAGGARISSVVDDLVVVDDPRVTGGQRFVSLSERRPIPRRAVLEQLTDTDDLLGLRVVGTASGAPGGGVGPIVWRDGEGPVVGDGAALLADVPVRDDSPTAVFVEGRVVVATSDGVALLELPAAGAGRTVGEEVASAVGVQRPRRSPVRPTELRLTVAEGIDPRAAAARLLLAAPSPSPRGVGSARAPIVAVDPATGDVTWRTEADVARSWPPVPPGSVVPSDGAVLHGDGSPIVVVDGGRVLAVSAADGRTRWRLDLEEASVLDATLVDGAVVLGLPTAVLALDARSGRQRWRVDVDALVTAVTGAGTTTLVGTSTGEVRLLDTDGSVRDRIALGSVRVEDVAVVDDRVVVIGADGLVTVFGPGDGTIAQDDEVRVP